MAQITRLLGIVAAFIVLFPLAVMAADFTPDPVDMAAAKREGGVSWYTSTPIEAAQQIARTHDVEPTKTWMTGPSPRDSHARMNGRRPDAPRPIPTWKDSAHPDMRER